MARHEKEPRGLELFRSFLRSPGVLRRMHAISRSILSSETQSADWEDLLQAATLRAFERAGTFRGHSEGEFIAWFTTIVRHLAIDEGRKRGHSALPLSPSVMDSLTEPGPTPEEQVAGRDLRNRRLAEVEAGLEELSPMEQAVINLSLRYGFAPEKVAELLGVSASAFRVALGRALSRLRSIVSAADD